MEEQRTITTQALLAIPASLKHLIEGLVFAADEPLSVRQIKAIYEQQEQDGQERHIEQEEIQQIIRELNDEYQKLGKAYRIVPIAGGFQFATLKEYAEWIGRLYKEQSRRKLSQSSLETLAIVAYKQPISKPEIESIRGVNCDYVMKTLLEKDLVTITARADTVGRPLLYGTTREFLRHFGLNEVTDLPRPREIEEILGESQFETERRMLEAQAGADQMKKEEEDFKSRLPHIPKKKPELDEMVQIVPRKRTQKLNLRESQNQEKISFEGDKRNQESEVTAAPSGKTEPLPEIVEPVQDIEKGGEAQTEEPPVPKPDMSEPTKTILEIMEEPAVEKAPELQAEIGVPEGPEQTVEAAPMEETGGASESNAGSLANLEQSSDVEKGAVPVIPPQIHEPEQPQPRRTRWTAWKEKVQTFLKKLFG